MAEGKLLLIGTPIGNLEDLSPRALEALRSCSMLLCEDTRHTRKLLTHFGISKKIESFHEHNEQAKADSVLDRIAFGDVVGLVSDAGLPVISDPGFSIVRRARERNLRVEPIAGPFAGALALIASGLPPSPFAFYGFPPHRKGERMDFYRRIADARMTAVVYESPHRIIASLEDALETFGETEMSLARELTKIHEEILNGPIAVVLSELRSRGTVKGELTLVFAPVAVEKPQTDADEISREFRRLRDRGLRRSDAVKLLAERHHLSRNELYQMLLETAEEQE
jgi:16S rRNA (cytidine1402-2'-O)-methyltransferase